MADNVVIYTVVHQPRRLKLPAQPIPEGASIEDVERCLFDERMNRGYLQKVADKCYYPATEMFTNLARQGFKTSIGMSLSLIRQMQAWDPNLLAHFQRLVSSPNVELVGVEPYHSFLFMIDLPAFVKRMGWVCDELEAIFGKRPLVTDTTEMCMSDTIYHALDRGGFQGAVMDGREWVMGWREPTYLYRHRYGNLRLLTRHLSLSDDVGYRFSNRTWPGWPLFADTYAHWVREARGDFVFLAWDYETFGEHHWSDSGIFQFIERLPEEFARRGIKTLTPSEAITKFRSSTHDLPLPQFPTTWAGDGGMEFFLGNSAQQAIFQLMLHCYNKARLSGNQRLLDLALWMIQSDNLHLIQWFGRSGSQAEVSAYFTPWEWWQLGPNRIIWEQQRVYRNFLNAMDPYVDGRPRIEPMPAGDRREQLVDTEVQDALTGAARQG